MDLTDAETHDEDGLACAWSTYEIYPDSGPGPGRWANCSVLIVCSTNDDLDEGYPSLYSTWDLWYENIEAAIKHTGKTRRGVGHRVYVELNGERI